MSRRDSKTGDLFAIPRPVAANPGSMDYRATISLLISQMLATAAAGGKDRFQVAAEMSRLTGKTISKLMLDGYTSQSRDAFNAPLWTIPALEVVCRCTVLSEWLATVRGGQLLVGADTLDAEIGRLEHEREEANDRLKELRRLRRSASNG